MQFPPPIHGVSVMNDIIRNSTLINNKFQCDYINLATAKNIDDLQKNSFFKYILTLKIIYLFPPLITSIHRLTCTLKVCLC